MKGEKPYQFYSTYGIRTPLFPINFFYEFTKGNVIEDKKFQLLFDSSPFKEALYLASPDLYTRFELWLEGKLTDEDKVKALKLSILKYVARISSRATPFGLFAGCSIGVFDYNTDIKISDFSKYEKFYQLENTLLSLIINTVLKEKTILSPLQKVFLDSKSNKKRQNKIVDIFV